MNNLIVLADGLPYVEISDPWQLVPNDQKADPERVFQLVSLEQWLDDGVGVDLRNMDSGLVGVWLTPDDDPLLLEPYLEQLGMIALNFPEFKDGRPYTQAYLLRTRLNWSGEMRAIGDVLRDQLSLMRQCGFNSFAIREDRSAETACRSLTGISVLYGRSVAQPEPLFRRVKRHNL